MDETKIVRSSVSIKCYAEADAAGVQGRARQKVMIDCFRQHRVLNPQKELSKRCLSKAEGKKGDEWKQSMLTCIAPIVTVEGE